MKTQWHKAFIDIFTDDEIIEEERIFSTKTKAINYVFSKLPLEFRKGPKMKAIRRFRAACGKDGSWSTTSITKVVDGMKLL